MNQDIILPQGVHVDVTNDLHVRVKGPKGETERDFSDPRINGMIVVKKNDQVLTVEINAKKDAKKLRAVSGTIRGHIKNMIYGVTQGYDYTLKIHYVHFPMNITTKDGLVNIKNFLGEKGARIAKIVGKTDVKIDKEFINVTGNNKEHVGQTAANIERACKQTQKDRRVFQDGIYIQEKGTQKR